MTASGNPPEVKPPGIQLLFAPDSFPLGKRKPEGLSISTRTGLSPNMGQGTVPCPILSMCRNVDFIQGAGKIIPRALVVPVPPSPVFPMFMFMCSINL